MRRLNLRVTCGYLLIRGFDGVPRQFTGPRLAIVVLLFFAGLLDYLDRLMPITMRLSIKEAIPMTDAQFGLLTTAFFLSTRSWFPSWGSRRIPSVVAA